MALSKRHEEGTNDLTRGWNLPSLVGQKNVKISANEATGSVHLAWYRGEHSGKAWSIKKLLKKHPDAASYLMEITGMDEHGVIVSKRP